MCAYVFVPAPFCSNAHTTMSHHLDEMASEPVRHCAENPALGPDPARKPRRDKRNKLHFKKPFTTARKYKKHRLKRRWRGAASPTHAMHTCARALSSLRRAFGHRPPYPCVLCFSHEQLRSPGAVRPALAGDRAAVGGAGEPRPFTAGDPARGARWKRSCGGVPHRKHARR